MWIIMKMNDESPAVRQGFIFCAVEATLVASRYERAEISLTRRVSRATQ